MNAINRLLLVLIVGVSGNQAHANVCSEPLAHTLQYIVESSAQDAPPATVPEDAKLYFEFLVSSNCFLQQTDVRLRGSTGDTDLYNGQVPMDGAESGETFINGLTRASWSPHDGGYLIEIELDLATFFSSPVAPGTYRLALDVANIEGMQSATMISGYTFDVTPAGPAPDSDGDGVLDDVDNCPFDANVDQADWNSDDEGDVCDDSDGDLWNDDIDNCVEVPNADQADNEPDGIGDACDNDDDNDGVLDGVDNCAFDYNPDQTDVNGDGFGDVCVPPSSDIDPSADIDPSVEVGEDVQVDKGVEVGAGSAIGDGVALDRNVEIGSGTEIGPDVEVSQSVEIGDNVTVGESAILDRGVVLCDNASVGAFAHIGRNSEVGYHGTVADFEVIAKDTFVPGPDPQPTSCTSP